MYSILDMDYEQVTSPVECVFLYDGSFIKERLREDGTLEAKLEDLSIWLEIFEDQEDIREGLKALADEVDTITWEQYQQKRTK